MMMSDDSASSCSLLGYGLVTILSVLYSGSVAVLKLFDVPELVGLSYSSSLVVTVFLIGAVGALYAILGGLKAVAVSDTLNGIGLLIVGVTVPILGSNLGGDLISGIDIVVSQHPEKLNAIGGPSDPTPFGTLFTGMIFANLFTGVQTNMSSSVRSPRVAFRRVKKASCLRLFQGAGSVFHDGPRGHCVSPLRSGTGLD